MQPHQSHQTRQQQQLHMRVSLGERIQDLRSQIKRWHAALAIVVLVILIALFSTIFRSSAYPPYKDQFIAFGTVVNLTLWDVSPELAQQASRQIRDDFAAMHRIWHAWEPGGLLAKINVAIAEKKSIEISQEAMELLRRTAELSEKSEHLFNPTIGKLVALWGFHSESWDGKPPLSAQLKSLVQSAPTMSDLLFSQENHLSSKNADVKIDLGGIAKGVAVDRAVAQLQQLGIEHAIVNTGGDLKAIGRHGDRAWRIGIRSPDGKDENGINYAFATVEPEGEESVFTSGDYERMFLHEGKRYHHIIDPRTGWPATGIRSVTVIHPDATVADAAATALLVAGKVKAARIAKQMGVEQFLMVGEEGEIYLTRAMEERVRFTESEKQGTIKKVVLF